MPVIHQQQDSPTPGESPGSRLSRWFSIRRGSAHYYDVGSKEANNLSPSTEINRGPPKNSSGVIGTDSSTPTKLAQLPEDENDSTHTFGLDLLMSPGIRSNDIARSHIRMVTPALPPAPSGLSQQQLKRRHIVAAIVHSENSYVATLQRLVNDYKRALEESYPPILSISKISILFHRLPDILKCHKLFRVTLAECVLHWDRDEQLGDIFVTAFSKPELLEAYSGFINNFSAAMELAKMEEKRKSALADFLKVKQIQAHDRLSFFGLMVKPVQRFPQFILFLQDLLKYTPQGHHDRMSLQLALSQLESLAEMLNERKREAEQYQAFKEMLGHISSTFNIRSLQPSDGSKQRYLLREDNMTQLEFNQFGFFAKSKQRRLLLLNDNVVCVSVAPKQSHDFGAAEKLSLKWMYPVQDVEIVDNSTSATLSRILTAGFNRGGSLKSNSSSSGNDLAAVFSISADNICNEMSNLMHDYEVISRINDLTRTLKGKYKEINTENTRKALNAIQSSIQRKDEEMAWVDSCCLQLIARGKSGKEGTFTFQTENPIVKKEWITELRLAQLALDSNNSPAWQASEHDRSPSTKVPLFVKAQSVFKSQHQTEVRCGCFYTITNNINVGTSRRRFKQQNYVWICSIDGPNSRLTVLLQHHQQAANLKDVNSFDLVNTSVTCMEFVKGVDNCKTKEEHYSILGDSVWIGTDNKKILIYSATNPEQEVELSVCAVPAAVTSILYYLNAVFVALTNGSLLIFRRYFDGTWMLRDPHVIELVSCSPVSSLLPINMNIYASCGNQIYVLNAATGDMTKTFKINHGSNVNLMTHSGVGLWISLKNSGIICLYHTETFKHLQDINIADSVLRVKSSPKETVNSSIHVTALVACKGLLWVGTNVGIVLTVPLPRLEGVPIIDSCVNVSCHAHFGPITFLLPLTSRTVTSARYTNDAPVFFNDDIPKGEPDCSNATKHNSNETPCKEVNDAPSGVNSDPVKNKLIKQNSLDHSLSNKLRAQLLSSPTWRRKRQGDLHDLSKIAKTLPRSSGTPGFFSQSAHSSSSVVQNFEHGYSDVYGLYGKLIFVKEDYDSEEGGQGNLLDMMYGCMRRSDPELAAIPGKVSTLDRRLRLKASRPRSLDLSNWSVESKSSSLYTSSGSEESMAIRLFGGRSVSRNSSSASHKTSVNGSDLGNISENSTIIGDVRFPSTDNIPKHSAPTENPNLEAKPPQQSSPPNVSTATLRKNKSAGRNAANMSELTSVPRTLITLMGGRGYWRPIWYTPNSKSTSHGSLSRFANSTDAYIILWEKKL